MNSLYVKYLCNPVCAGPDQFNQFIRLIQTISDFAYITFDTGILQPVKNFKYSIEKVSFLEILVISLQVFI